MLETIKTDVTSMLKIKQPVILAGMNTAAGPDLVAAVTNAGGLGVLGGVSQTPKAMKFQIDRIKSKISKGAPFGVDLLLPQVGGSARKTNKDQTEGNLPELVDIIIASGASLFVSAVGVPPKWLVEKMHANGILIMNMIGSPKHAPKAIAVGVDIICAQGGEAGGHTGEISTSILIPAVVDICKKHKSPLQPSYTIPVVAAGGIYDGRGLAMALSLGAQAVWVGTRFVASKEGGAPANHKQGVIDAGYHDTFRSVIYTGRPLRVIKNEQAVDFEENKQTEIKRLLVKGTIPIEQDIQKKMENKEIDHETFSIAKQNPLLCGQVAGSITTIETAKDIVESMVKLAIVTLNKNKSLISKL